MCHLMHSVNNLLNGTTKVLFKSKLVENLLDWKWWRTFHDVICLSSIIYTVKTTDCGVNSMVLIVIQ